MKTTDPQNELLDVVNSDNQVIGQNTRGEIHRLNQRHRACHMIVFNSRGEVFVQQRSLSKDNSPGLWDSSSAGHVDAGESTMDCAVRELKEELGLTIPASELQLVCELDATPVTGMEFASVYKLKSDARIVVDPVEVLGGRWCSPAELEDWIVRSPDEFTPVFLVIWKKLCDDDGH